MYTVSHELVLVLVELRLMFLNFNAPWLKTFLDVIEPAPTATSRRRATPPATRTQSDIAQQVRILVQSLPGHALPSKNKQLTLVLISYHLYHDTVITKLFDSDLSKQLRALYSPEIQAAVKEAITPSHPLFKPFMCIIGPGPLLVPHEQAKAAPDRLHAILRSLTSFLLGSIWDVLGSGGTQIVKFCAGPQDRTWLYTPDLTTKQLAQSSAYYVFLPSLFSVVVYSMLLTNCLPFPCRSRVL